MPTFYQLFSSLLRFLEESSSVLLECFNFLIFKCNFIIISVGCFSLFRSLWLSYLFMQNSTLRQANFYKHARRKEELRNICRSCCNGDRFCCWMMTYNQCQMMPIFCNSNELLHTSWSTLKRSELISLEKYLNFSFYSNRSHAWKQYNKKKQYLWLWISFCA